MSNSKKYRAQQIVIEVPREGEEAWIQIVVQEVIKNEKGDIINVIPRAQHVHKQGNEIGFDIYNYLDPILKETRQISGYGLQLAISSAVVDWMKDKFGGEVDSAGDLIIEDSK